MEFHGEFASADASALSESASRLTLYRPGTVLEALAIDDNDFVEVSDVVIDYTGSTARTITLYDGADATVGGGEKIHEATLAQNGHIESTLSIKHVCQKGTYPKVKTSGSGQVTVLIRGVIRKLP
ncbi:MAG TPA: hypothetical protein VD932_02715 [Aquabacterium sp.]|nr:hypothetical protein [Aquabacterium sp.]